MQKIAIFQALFLGDLLMTTPALRALRQRFPEAEISLIGLPWAESFIGHTGGAIDRLVAFQGYPGIAELAVDPERTAQFIATQRAYGYDLAIQMHGDGSVSNGLVAELGAGKTLGFARPGDARLTWSLPYRDEQNEVLRWLDLVAKLDAPDHDTTLLFVTRPSGHSHAAELLVPLYRTPWPLVGLHVGAKDPARRWPAERFAALGDALAARYNAQLVLTASAGERDLTAAVLRSLRASALDLTGRTDLDTLAAVLSRLDLLVTNDTGASHMAAAVRTPSVVLFGPSHPARFAPLDRNRHRVVDALARTGHATDPATALQQLPVEVVLEACHQQLASPSADALSARAVGYNNSETTDPHSTSRPPYANS